MGHQRDVNVKWAVRATEGVCDTYGRHDSEESAAQHAGDLAAIYGEQFQVVSPSGEVTQCARPVVRS